MRTLCAAWMTGPSAIGSENGMPSSMISTPPACMASKRGTVSSLRGKPEGMKVVKTVAPFLRVKPAEIYMILLQLPRLVSLGKLF